MRSQRRSIIHSFIAGLAVAAASFPKQAPAAPVADAPGWTVKLYAAVPGVCEGLSIDGGSKVYVGGGHAGIYRIDTTGAVTLWSTAPSMGQATLADGETYAPSRDLDTPSSYVWHVTATGSYSQLASRTTGTGWVWTAITPGRKLYADVLAGIGQGLYAIDATTGAYSLLVAGGPGPGGDGIWWGMTNDGETIYAGGDPDYSGTKHAIYTWDGTNLLVYSTTPALAYGICKGPDGLYAVDEVSVPDGGHVWKATPGGAAVFAHGFDSNVSIAFDSVLQRFYVLTQGNPSHVWVISRDITPTHSETWGQVHVRYR